MTLEEINTMKYRVCCPMCDNKKCVRGTDSCEAEQWAKSKALGQEPWETQMIDKSNFSQEQYKADLQSAYDCGKASVKPCEDTISRADAVRVASGYCHPAKELAKLPPATPKPKVGHWIMPRNDDGMSDPIEYQVRCSECGFDLDPQTWHEELHRYDGDKYCPHCGKRMVKPQESEGK